MNIKPLIFTTFVALLVIAIGFISQPVFNQAIALQVVGLILGVATMPQWMRQLQRLSSSREKSLKVNHGH